MISNIFQIILKYDNGLNDKNSNVDKFIILKKIKRKEHISNDTEKIRLIDL